MEADYKDLIAFHGHSCPGLAIGYRMTTAAMDFLADTRAKDEELVAIVENDACGVDALQMISGCTFGKGNLIFRDYGKHVYTLYSRSSRRGVRVVFNDSRITEAFRKDRDRLVDWLLTVPVEEIVSSKEVRIDEPEPARIMTSIACDACGEKVMETRVKEKDGKPFCIPCMQKGL